MPDTTQETTKFLNVVMNDAEKRGITLLTLTFEYEGKIHDYNWEKSPYTGEIS